MAAHGQLRMTREEMERGFAAGSELIQEEWAHPQEIAWVSEFIEQGKAVVVAPWEYRAGFQCERRIVRGVRQPCATA